MGKPPVHLWIYNHPFFGISDQVSFFVTSLRQHGYRVSVGRNPSATSLNVVIENFSTYDRNILVGFCKAYKKRVAVILTEHMDFENGQILFHGAPLGTESDYMHRSTQSARLMHLIECVPFIQCFFILGDLPQLRNARTFLPDIEVRPIPFPDLQEVRGVRHRRAVTVCSDLAFTGALTGYREKVLASLRGEGLSITCPGSFVSRNRRDNMNRSARMVLNIPQSESWRWLSPMRIIAALACGRPALSLGKTESSAVSNCCTAMDIRAPSWISDIKKYIEQSEALYRCDFINYCKMVKHFEGLNPFPDDVFECWRITDLLMDE